MKKVVFALVLMLFSFCTLGQDAASMHLDDKLSVPIAAEVNKRAFNVQCTSDPENDDWCCEVCCNPACAGC